MTIVVRRATVRDLEAVAKLNASAFSGNATPSDAKSWLSSRFMDPTFRMWVAVAGSKVVGYITWQIQGGWNRKKPVVELEQMAVMKSQRGNGIGHKLIQRTRRPVGEWIRETNRWHVRRATIIVWALVDNPANALYRKFFTEIAGFRYQYSRPENELRGTISIPSSKK